MTQPLPLELEEFLSWLGVERGRSANTLAAYRRDLAAYHEFLAGRHLTPATVTEPVVEDYLAFLRAAGRAPASVARALVSVRSLHRFLEDEGHMATNPAGDVQRPRVPSGLPKALSEAEVLSLLSAVTGDEAVARRDRAILEVLYGCGLRVSELVGLSLADLDLGAHLLRAFGKGAKERIVPVGRSAAGTLRAWLTARRAVIADARRPDLDAVFVNPRGRRLSRQGAWQIIQRHGLRAGLGERLSPHVLRHSCATHMVEHGADLRVVQELLGHASVSTTQVYTKVTQSRLRAVYDRAHPRSGLRAGTDSPLDRGPGPQSPSRQAPIH